MSINRLPVTTTPLGQTPSGIFMEVSEKVTFFWIHDCNDLDTGTRRHIKLGEWKIETQKETIIDWSCHHGGSFFRDKC